MSDFFRGRRLRRNPQMREFIRETDISARNLVMPYFVVETDDQAFRKPVASMPGVDQLSLTELEKEVAEGVKAGLHSVILFGIPAQKDYQGSEAFNPEGIVQQAVRRLKARFPQLVVITDVCLCEFTSHGHCGLLKSGDTTGEVHNDPTLTLLAKTAVSHAEAGADIVAPSDMMDGRVLAIREALDANGFHHIPIMSYAVKYASAYYGPFRDAAESTPQHGDRKTYQMDPANSREAMREAGADVLEGADFLMVKPAGPYMDIIRMVRDNFELPVAAYQVSGEYSMIKAAALNDWIDGDKVALESLIGLRRAGAEIILTYFTVEMLRKGLIKA
ncbi:porphobilinogen synthase [Oleidesulfovibrio sp.]|uniref:porphobilinogen synthase n=1 Tax=Oleidesulfovibrio sp. TaxID=2909707 RepID=UPI003A87DCD7